MIQIAILVASVWSGGAYGPDPKVQACCLDLYAHRDVQPLRRGFIDPTLPPYGARGDGDADDSDSLQRAINDSYLSQMPLVLPGGRIFLLTKQLRMLQDESLKPYKIRARGFQIYGATQGGRPVLRLRDGSDVARGIVGDGLVKPVLLYFALIEDGESDPASHYSARLRNVEIDLGANPDVVAVSMSGAQLCSIEDVAIRGRAFFAGVAGLPGSGGFTVGLNVTGGDFGIYQQQFRPTPSVSDVGLISQRVAGVHVSSSRGPLVLSGVHIQPAPGAVAVEMRSTDANGGLLLEDGVLHLSQQGSVAVNNSGGGDLVLRNTYVKASVIARSVLASAARVVEGDVDRWYRVPLYGYTGSGSGLWEGEDQGFTKPSSYPTEASAAVPSSYRDPSELRQLHGWQGPVPGFDHELLVDIALDYGATPEWVNATDDDRAAIQRALDDAVDPEAARFGAAVFVPHGVFHIGAPLRVPGGAALIGTGTMRSLIHMSDPTRWPGGPMLRLEGARKGAVLSDIGLYAYVRGPFLEVAAPEVLVRDLLTELNVTDPAHPLEGREPELPRTQALVSFGERASGRAYGLSLDHVGWGGEAPGAPPLVSARGAAGPLHFYALSTEHQRGSDPQVSVVDSASVHFHAWKFESPLSSGGSPSAALGGFVNCTDISVFGGSGNYNIVADRPRGILEVSQSAGVHFAGIVRKQLADVPDVAKALAIDLDSGAAVDDRRALLLFEPSQRVVV